MATVVKRFIAATSLWGVYAAAQSICEEGGSGTVLPLFPKEYMWDEVGTHSCSAPMIFVPKRGE